MVSGISFIHTSTGTPALQKTVSDPPYRPGDDAVAFEIRTLESGPTTRSWLGTYESGGKRARFRIQLDQPKAEDPTGVLRGRFVAEPGSNASSLLPALAKALEAKKVPRRVRRVASLPFYYFSFGNHVPRFADGSFGPNGGGNWIPIKIFFGNDEAEVYLNLNPAIGKAEFTIKDPGYGDKVIAELAKVL